MIHSLRALYITVLIVIVMLICLLIGSFIFFEKTTHRIYYYDIRMNDRLVETCKIDRFATEDRIIYKAASALPFDPLFTESKAKLVLDRKYALESYYEERVTRDGLAGLITYIEVKNKLASFLSRLQSIFVYAAAIPVRSDIFIFKEDSPLTYLPIIENYDFRKGRSQGFNGLTCVSQGLPPVKRYITFTSVRNEYLKIDGRKIKTENLILKIKNYPQGSIWVARSDHKLIMIDLPKMNLRITRSFRQKPLIAEDMPAPAGPYISKEVTFASKNLELAGTLTIPSTEGKYPAVLLVSGGGPYNRDYAGVLTSIADYLARNGYCALRFDKRGLGKSSGDAAWPLTADTADDINAALKFLALQPEVERDRVAILAHGDGAIAASRAVAGQNTVRAIVLMAPELRTISDYKEKPDLFAAVSEKGAWDEAYRTLVLQTSRDTSQRVQNSKFNWAYILGKRVYMAEMKDRIDNDPIANIKKLTLPVLTVQGKDNSRMVNESAGEIDSALKESGNAESSLVYYSYLNHLFGEPVIDGTHPIHYSVSAEVLSSIRAWLDKNLAKKEAVP